MSGQKVFGAALRSSPGSAATVHVIETACEDCVSNQISGLYALKLTMAVLHPWSPRHIPWVSVTGCQTQRETLLKIGEVDVLNTLE